MAAKFVVAALAGIALAAPVEERQSCAAVWGQCGGTGWSGSTCCASGSYCALSNPYYSQCLPGAGSSSSSAPPSSKSASTLPPATSTTKPAGSTTTKPAGSTTTHATSTVTKPPVGSGTATWAGNPFSGVSLWANSYYRSEVTTDALPSLSGAMATAAAAVADVPSFQWLDSLAHVSLMQDSLTDIRAANAAGGNYAGQFIVYDLPDRDCAAAASNGEYSIADGGVADYFNYIDTIVTLVKTFSDVRMLLIIEPDSLANLVTNLSVEKCANAQGAYLQCINYALINLNLPNVAMYIDAGHAGWLGWSANLPPAAELFASVYKNASSPAAVRGLATNVANYNAWEISTPPSYTSGDSNYDEKLYINALSPLLTQNGWSGAQFIVDQGRSGKQPTGQLAWGDWCNVVGTGFGTRPTAVTDDTLLDAIVWAKPGGECDGTSNTSSPRYDYHCGLADALQPAPEAGTWFQAMFVQLLTNADPSFM